jgi:hypothetical protein
MTAIGATMVKIIFDDDDDEDDYDDDHHHHHYHDVKGHGDHVDDADCDMMTETDGGDDNDDSLQ